jgi:hypothetical protein
VQQGRAVDTNAFLLVGGGEEQRRFEDEAIVTA